MRTTTITCCLVLGLVACLATVGCGVDDSCVDGKACECSGDCEQTCGGSGASCAFKCPAGATCSFFCPGGGCSASGAGATSITIDCPGNSCSLTCSGGQTCKITGCSSSCQLSCGGASDCAGSCDLFAGCTKS